MDGDQYDKLADESPILAGVTAASVQGMIATGERAGLPVRRVLSDPADAVHATRNALGGYGASARVSVRRPDAVGELAEVRVTVPYRVAAPLFGGVLVEIAARATMRVER